MGETKMIPGIDLGTTNSAIAIWDSKEKNPTILPNREGRKLTPSVVTFDPDSRATIVGEPALDRMIPDPGNVIYSVKRYIGLSFRNESEEIRHYQQTVTYSIEEALQQKVIVRACAHILRPEDVSKEVLHKLKTDAEAALGREVQEVVITVPAYFNRTQRHATAEAGRLAGLEVKRLINEPTAAALAFDLGTEPCKFVVYDLGGGTFDVSIIEITRYGTYRVIVSNGDTHLGGDDFDLAIADWLRERFKAQHGFPLPINDLSLNALLREEAEAAKIRLSEVQETWIDLPGICTLDGQTYDLKVNLERQQMEKLIKPKIDRTIEICEEALRLADKKQQDLGGLAPGDISQVLLVGGQTLTPAVRAALDNRFGWPLNDSVDPAQAVALGAAVLGGYESGDEYLEDRFRLRDVIAQPLMIKMSDGSSRTIVSANEQIPLSTKESDPTTYTNTRAGQKSIRFRLYQGEEAVADDNPIGEVPLQLVGGPYEEGKASAKFWIEIDLDGILHVYAQEQGTDSEPEERTFNYFYHIEQQEAEQLG
jgi:molecular chaperone DnaK